MQIPFVGLIRQYQNLRTEILDTIDQVYLSGRVLDGPYVKKLEETLARYCHRTHAVAVNSGTQALIFSIIATNLENKNIIIPDVSFVATLNSVLMTKAKPLFCDVDEYGLMDITRIKSSQTPDGLMFVNLFGNVVDQDKIRLYTDFFNNAKTVVIEDAAQSLGAKYNGMPSGSFGDVSVLSFDPMKNLPNYGSGGMILTDHEPLADKIRDLRDNGKRGHHYGIGTNSKISEADAAILLLKFRYFEEWQRRRTAIAEYYNSRFSNYLGITKTSNQVIHAWHKYALWCRDDPHLYRSFVLNKLYSLGVETKIHYDTALHEHPITMSISGENYFNATNHCKTEFSLPIYPELTDVEVEYIADSVISCIKN